MKAMRSPAVPLAIIALLAASGCEQSKKAAGERAQPKPAPTVEAADRVAIPAMSAEERQALPGAIAFVSERDGHRAVYVVPAAGGKPRRLVGETGADVYPGPVSRDGKVLSLVSARGDTEDTHQESLWALDLAAASSAPRMLVASRRVRNPALTPDGRSLVFEGDLASFSDLFRVSLRGGEPVRLTDAEGGSFQPSFTADGAIVFTSSRHGIAQIYRMAADGSAVERLTHSGAEDLAPLAAPVGDLVLFTSGRDGRDRLYLMRTDGGGLRRLHDGERPETDELEPVWSPDGSRVAYLARTERETRLWITEVATGMTRPLGPGGTRDDQPVFSSDGEHVVFVSERGGNPDLYIVRADGGAIARLTRHASPDWLPRWLPEIPQVTAAQLAAAPAR